MSALAPLILLPVIARTASTAEWVAVALGQSLGLFGSIAVAWGWTLNGPVQVGDSEAPHRRSVYFDSIRSRAAVAAVVVPVACLAGALAAPPTTRALAATTALAITCAGLSPAWYAVGVGRPQDIALFDTGPRIFAAALAAGIVGSSGGHLLAYPLLLGSASLLGTVAYSRRVSRLPPSTTPRRRSIGKVLRRQAVPATTSIVAGTYTAISVTLVAVATTVGESARFSSGARLYQFMLLGLSAVSQSLLADTRAGIQSRRHLRTAGSLHLVAGLGGLAALGLIGPWASSRLFTDSLRIGPVESWLFGIAFFELALATFVAQQLLIPQRRNRQVLWSVAAGSVVGIPATVGLAHTLGATGGALALTLIEMLVLVISCWGSADSRAVVRGGSAAAPPKPEGSNLVR